MKICQERNLISSINCLEVKLQLLGDRYQNWTLTKCVVDLVADKMDSSFTSIHLSKESYTMLLQSKVFHVFKSVLAAKMYFDNYLWHLRKFKTKMNSASLMAWVWQVSYRVKLWLVYCTSVVSSFCTAGDLGSCNKVVHATFTDLFTFLISCLSVLLKRSPWWFCIILPIHSRSSYILLTTVYRFLTISVLLF